MVEMNKSFAGTEKLEGQSQIRVYWNGRASSEAQTQVHTVHFFSTFGICSVSAGFVKA